MVRLQTEQVKRAGLVIAVILLALGGWGIWRGAGPRRLHIRVVDSTGTPVAGALLTPDGIRGTDRGHYWWRDDFAVKPIPVRTDPDGRATILYPAYIHERIRSIEISFGVDHPDFSPERPFISVASPRTASTPPLERLLSFLEDARSSGRLETVRLRRAAIIAVTATLDGHSLPAERFHVQVVPESGMHLKTFTPMGDILMVHQVPPGNFQLRAVAFCADGRTCFSLLTNGVAASMQTNHFALTLEPALRVRGRLQGVPPVQNGWVNVRVVNPTPKSSEPMMWADFAPISENGEFDLPNLPAGRLEILALCDGYVSQNPPSKPRVNHVYPRRFDVPLQEELSLPMIPTSIVEIKVLDPAGKPVSDADISAWPNVFWGDYYSTVFASDFYRSSESLQSTNKVGRLSKRTFSIKTDRNGIAQFSELPGTKQDFGLEHKIWELPINQSHNRSESFSMTPGLTNHLILKVQPKGKEFREE